MPGGVEAHGGGDARNDSGNPIAAVTVRLIASPVGSTRVVTR